MTNLIGTSQTITTPNTTFVLSEEYFVGLEGYKRTLVSGPRLGKTSVGTTNYKQPNSSRPTHKFDWRLVLPDDLALSLKDEVVNQTLLYKKNNDRNFPLFILDDNRVAYYNLIEYPIEVSPTSIINEKGPNELGRWVFPRFRIVVTNFKWDVFGSGTTSITMSALQIHL